MKFIVFFTCAFFINATASVYSQNTRFTFSVEGQTIKDVLRLIEKESEFRFLYNDDFTDLNQKVTIDVKNNRIESILDQMLNQSDITYRVLENNLIVITPTEMIQGITITGTVTDNTGATIPGVNVTVKGATTGAISDFNGKYQITVPSSDAVLVFSFMGYETQEVAVGDRKIINVTLSEDVRQLEEVVVVGFGTQKKVNLIGAVTAVGSETFENRPVANIGQVLQGVVPNLSVNISDGAPNTVPSFNIRGGTTIAKDSNGNWVVENGSPLIIVDGVETSATQLNQMNPNDVESMSVVKDASAAAIYGTKAAFGVILITTKSGKFNQKAKISYGYDVLWSTPSALPDILNAEEIATFVIENAEWTLRTVSQADRDKLAGVQKYMADPRPENYWIPGSTNNSMIWVGNMNPYKLAMRKWYPLQKHNLSISGGTERVSYYVSLGYQDQAGAWNIGGDNQKRYNALLRLNAKVTDWFNLDTKITYNQTKFEGPYIAGGKGTPWGQLKNEADKNINMPIMTAPTDPTPNTYTDNFLAWVSYGARTSNESWTTVFTVSPEFIVVPKMLKVKADLSYKPQGYNAKRRSPEHSYITYTWTPVQEIDEIKDNRARLEKTNTNEYQINTYADFNHTFAGKHELSAVAGFSQEQVYYTQIVANLRGLFSPDIMKPEAAEDVTLHTINTGAQKRTGRAVFGRINYIFDNKYLLEFNARYDGSSRFTKDGRYVFCPSYSVGWRLSEESFMEATRNWLSNFKIRFTSGELLNQPSSYYPYQAIMTSNSANYIIGDKIVSTVRVPNLGTPSLTFEKVRTDNFGVDIAVLNNKLNYTFDWFHRKTRDILVAGSEAYPTVLGADPPLVNSGKMETKGFEMVLEWKDRLHNGLRYNVALTLGDNRSKVLYFPSNPTKIIGQLYDGSVPGDIWGYETGGILQAEDLVLNAAANKYDFYGPYRNTTYYPGNAWVRDINGDGLITTGSGTVDNPGDQRIIGNNTSRYRYGVNLNVSWKGFDLNALFQGVAQRDLWISSSTYWGGGTNAAGSKWMYERAWRPDRTDAKFPRYGGAPDTQTRWLVNGAFLRLRQVVLAYSLPNSICDKMHIGQMRFTLGGYNLFEITDIPNVFDPEQVSDAYPKYRSVSIGAQITF